MNIGIHLVKTTLFNYLRFIIIICRTKSGSLLAFFLQLAVLFSFVFICNKIRDRFHFQLYSTYLNSCPLYLSRMASLPPPLYTSNTHIMAKLVHLSFPTRIRDAPIISTFVDFSLTLTNHLKHIAVYNNTHFASHNYHHYYKLEK